MKREEISRLALFSKFLMHLTHNARLNPFGFVLFRSWPCLGGSAQRMNLFSIFSIKPCGMKGLSLSVRFAKTDVSDLDSEAYAWQFVSAVHPAADC